jgi:beta-1,4-N-acetylglucosaminyltransferase
MNVYLISSPGGHLTQILSLLEALEECDVYVITLDFPNMRGVALDGVKEIYRIQLISDYSMKFGLPLTLLKSFFLFFHLFLKKRPHLIFSMGSEIALPGFLVGKFLFRSKVVYIESLTRIEDLSLTGKIVYHFSDLFLVQWEKLTQRYPKAGYRGRMI